MSEKKDKKPTFEEILKALLNTKPPKKKAKLKSEQTINKASKYSSN